MPTCHINYDNNPNGIFYAGQTLSGVIQLNNDKRRDIRGVTLRIEGFSMVLKKLFTSQVIRKLLPYRGLK